MKDTNNEYESAKELLESVGMRIDERTAISDRKEDRFSPKPISSAARKNESIPYADLPWAEKQQNTITEQKMQKLFPDGRLSDAMDRLFEGASCIGTGYKYEEDYLKKEDQKEE